MPRQLPGHRNLDHLFPFSFPMEEKPPRAGKFSMRGKKNHHSHHLHFFIFFFYFSKIKGRLQFGKAAVNNPLVQVAPGLASSPTAPSITNLLPKGTRLMGLTEHISPHPPDTCSCFNTPAICSCIELAGGTRIKQDSCNHLRSKSARYTHSFSWVTKSREPLA